MAESKKAKMKQNALLNYFQSSYEELRKVTWPTRNQAVRLTFLVLGFCFATAAILGLVDYVFSTGHQALLDLGTSTTATEQPVATPISGNAVSDPITVIPVETDASAAATDEAAPADDTATTDAAGETDTTTP